MGPKGSGGRRRKVPRGSSRQRLGNSPPARSSQRLGNCIPFHYLHVPKLYCFADPPCPPPNPVDPPGRGGLGGHAQTKKRQEQTKNRHFIHPASCGGEDVFFGLGCNDDKGSDAPFRTIDKRKRNARGAKGCGASRTAGARGSRAAAPEAPEPKNA